MKVSLFGYLSLLILTCAVSAAQAKEFISDIRTPDVLELYTSEGCSSCPPADRWFTTLKQKPDVFKRFIPMAFHVDYWNSLGWADRFSAPVYTARQHQHVRAGNVRQSYTPQVVLNGAEWRGHLRGVRQWDADSKKAGVLKAVLKDNKRLMISFSPASGDYFNHKQLTLNVAYLGMGLQTAVKRGENAGRTLRHDFVVLQHDKQTVDAHAQQWQLTAPAVPAAGQQQTALVIWLSDPLTQRFVQAVGGYL